MQLYTENYTHDADIELVGKSIHVGAKYHPELVAELKRFDRARWNPSSKAWTFPASPRNRFALSVMADEAEVQRYFSTPEGRGAFAWDCLRESQKDMVEWADHKKQCGWAAEMRTGKTLSYFALIARYPDKPWWMVAPKNVIPVLEYEGRKWGMDLSNIRFFTYDDLKKEPWLLHGVPFGVIYDECTYLKSMNSQRTKAAMELAAVMDDAYGHENCIRVGGTGTPQPKDETDWLGMSHAIRPGWLPWGNIYKLQEYLFVREQQTGMQGQTFWKTTQVKDGGTCVKCGGTGSYVHRGFARACAPCQGTGNVPDMKSLFLEWVHGMWIVVRKKDVMELPDMEVVPIYLEPDEATRRVAKAITEQGLSTIEVLSRHRQLSDGFQYRAEGPTVRAKSNPKMDAAMELLDAHEWTSRFCIFAAYTEAIDWIVEECEKRGWKVMRCDGKVGAKRIRAEWDKSLSAADCLELFNKRDDTDNIVIVGHPKSLGYGTDLTASCAACMYSLDFNGETFMQSIVRGHGPDMDHERGWTLYFLLCLPTDENVLVNLLQKRNTQDGNVADIRSLYEGEPVRMEADNLQALFQSFVTI